MEHLGRPATVTAMRQRLARLEASDTARWGVLRVDEMLCHVREAYRVVGMEVTPERILLSMPPAMLKFFALCVPIQWPKKVETVPALKRGALPKPAAFALEKERLLGAYDSFIEDAAKRHAHPMFGSMTTWDWRRWGYLHADHHLRQFGR